MTNERIIFLQMQFVFLSPPRRDGKWLFHTKQVI